MFPSRSLLPSSSRTDDAPSAIECVRLAALHRYEILDTPEEPEFNDFTRLAAHICQTPIAVISLVDHHRQWFKSAMGLGVRETPLDVSICKHAILQKELFVIPDTTLDERFRCNPLVAGDPHLRFYAGALLESSDSLPLGTLCVLDYQPRQLTDLQKEALAMLARQVMNTLELRLSRRLLHNTIESISDAFFTLDHEFRFTSLNSQVVRLLGRERGDFLHQVIWEVCDLGGDDHFASQCRRAAEAKELMSFETFYERTSLWLDVRVYPSVDGLTVYFQDITTRRKKEEQLRLLETCVSHLNDIVLITEVEPIDEPGPRILFVNDAFVRLTGYSREEAIGRSPRFLQGPNTQVDAIERIHAAAKACMPVREEVINYSKSGQEHWLEMDIVPVADAAGHFTHLVAIQRDVTRRKRAEAALRASEAMMSAAQRIAHIGSWEMDLNREESGATILRWSDELFRIAGLEPGTVDLTNELFFKIAHPEDHVAIRQAMVTALRDQQPYSIVHRLIRPDGQVRIVQEEAHIFFDETTGKPLKMVGTAHDITERKSLEQQILRAQRMESIGTLAGGIAHDLNNVLAPIMMAIDLLKLKESDPARKKILSTIETSVKRGADMVKQVLYFARGVAGERLAVHVGDQLKEIENIVRDTFPKNIILISDVPDDLWSVEGDATQLHQVLLNLCVNARDAMSTGGMLTLKSSNAMLDNHYAGMNPESRPGPHIVIQVEDTGTGIPTEVMDRIFEPFFTTKEQGKGTGLGLSTSLGIVKSHGGFIRVQSEEGEGTTFRVYLPAQANTVVGVGTSALIELPRGNDELILVIDDEFAVRQITQQTLEAFGYRVLLASDGAEAVAIFAVRMNEIAAVITDMMMPVMDGAATIQVLMRMQPDVRIIAASGLSANGLMSKAVVSGVRHFLRKPYNAEVMLQALTKVIGG